MVQQIFNVEALIMVKMVWIIVRLFLAELGLISTYKEQYIPVLNQGREGLMDQF